MPILHPLHRPPSAVCPEGWTTIGNRCFKYNSIKRNYYDSVGYCTSQGGHIASIRSDEENKAVGQLIADDDAYIGAESDGKGNWKWIDGSSWWQPTYIAKLDGGIDKRIFLRKTRWSEEKWSEVKHVVCSRPVIGGDAGCQGSGSNVVKVVFAKVGCRLAGYG